MKVILLKDVARIGRKYDVKEVPDGHAQNFLIPRKLAEPATAANLKRIETRGAHIDAERSAQAAQLVAVRTFAETAPLVIVAPANEQGHLFKGLRAADIAAAITVQTGIAVPDSAVSLARPLKEAGAHELTLTGGGAEVRVTITVTAE